MLDLKIYNTLKSLRMHFELQDWNEDQLEAFESFLDRDENIERSQTL